MTKLLPIALAFGLFANCVGSGKNPVLPGETPMPAGSTRGGGGTATTTSSTTADSNSVEVVVDQGPQDIGYTNGLFATVTLCEPGSNTCQTFDHMLVDTGSVGVRILESQLTLSLPELVAGTGRTLAECTPFVEGTAWGPVKRADVRMGEESASALPIQVIGDATYPLPSSCTGTPITDLDTLGANGILGVGVYLQDCGAACEAAGRSNPGVYFACGGGSACSVTSVSVLNQVAHPVAAFPVDNNGVIIQLPSIASSGAVSATGRLVFGIGTQPNNGLGSSVVLPLDTYGFVTTTYPAAGASYTSYLDSGSNAIFFLNASAANIKACSGNLKDFYCPSSTLSLNAKIGAAGAAGVSVSFAVANTALLNANNFAFNDLAGPMPGYPSDSSIPGFDWGLPFYFGRNVTTAIEGRSTPGGTGPYFAF
jgi:hypothetical protein